MDRRALPGLLTGLVGCGLAVAGALAGSAFLTVLAAACALAAGGVSLALLERVRQAERRAAIAVAELSTLREIELATPGRSRSVVDFETGLPDGRFFEVALESRVAAARRHLWPVTIVLVELVVHPDRRAETVAGFCRVVRETLREADAVCRIGLDTYGLILEDTNEAGGVWAAERLQAAVANEPLAVRALAAGVASYPTHGLHADEVLRGARAALARASAADAGFGLGHVEVATAVDHG